MNARRRRAKMSRYRAKFVERLTRKKAKMREAMRGGEEE